MATIKTGTLINKGMNAFKKTISAEKGFETKQEFS